MKDFKRNGHGELIYTSGNKYVGEWKDNNRNGCNGEYHWKNGYIYKV